MEMLDPGMAARRLLAAVLLRAVLDAQRGNGKARSWLASDGAEWADFMGICHPEVVRTWVASLPQGENSGPKRSRVLVAAPEGTGLDRFAVLMVEWPDVTNKEAAEALNLARVTVRNYRMMLRRRDHEP